jgi:hypothetical protein
VSSKRCYHSLTLALGEEEREEIKGKTEQEKEIRQSGNKNQKYLRNEGMNERGKDMRKKNTK